MFVDLSFLNSTGFANLEEFLYYIINYAITISVVLAVVALIFADLSTSSQWGMRVR